MFVHVSVYHHHILPLIDTMCVHLGSEGLGFTVVTRDSSVHAPGPILVKNILPRGAAVKDGRLQPGDRILEVRSVYCTLSPPGELYAAVIAAIIAAIVFFV